MKQKTKVFVQQISPLIRSMPRPIYLMCMCIYAIYIEFIPSMIYYLYNGIITFLPNHFLRTLYLKYIMRIKVGKSSFIHMGARFEGNITIGNNSVIGRKCVLMGEITIKNNVSITAESYLFSTSHVLNSSTFSSFSKPIVIEDYVWLGVRSVVLPGVHIGKGAVLGAASTATRDIPCFSVYAGSPAKEISKRTEMLDYTLYYSPYFQ